MSKVINPVRAHIKYAQRGSLIESVVAIGELQGRSSENVRRNSKNVVRTRAVRCTETPYNKRPY